MTHETVTPEDIPVKKRRGRPVKSNSAETRIRLIDSARHVFAERGFDRATVGEICKGADIVGSAFYRYYPDKESLYEAVFNASIIRLWDLLHMSTVNQRTARDALTALVATAERAGDSLPWYSEFLTALPIETYRNARFAPLLEQRTNMQRRTFEHIARLGRESGEFSEFRPQGEFAEHLRLTVMGWLVERNLNIAPVRVGSEGLLHLIGLGSVS
ncbi:TetR/AcrR family transcriptional regulator [Rhodococcus sp. USK13]|uniref:TetR/AcrR family transcriptional regulator n=1 Tax=Rhodococcus sp. USK13 TaxID=2806442 RepID=UPI001BCC48D1|nr:TetR/AcrR family transcriptional regulator [Rhodococcus sp. USK13]